MSTSRTITEPAAFSSHVPKHKLVKVKALARGLGVVTFIYGRASSGHRDLMSLKQLLNPTES